MMRNLLTITKALADGSRLRILAMLRTGELCVCQIGEVLGLAPSTVSKHLSILKKEGIIEDDKRGLQVYYSLACPCILDCFHCIERVMHIRIGKQKAALKGG